jgi:neutral ceramidase
MRIVLRYICLASMTLAAPALVAASDLRVGRGAVDITPAAGTPMLTPQRPPFEIKLATQPHDPLHAKAVVLEAGGKRAAIVLCDLTSIPLDIIQEARRLIDETTDVPADWAMISATHTHTTPQIRMRFLGNADELAREKARDYIARLPGMIAEAVQLAEADLQAAEASACVGEERTVSFNRRFFLRDGTVEANPFKGEDEKLGQILRPAGPVDPEVGLVAFTGSDGAPLAMMVNFAIHLDTMGGDQPSADFPFMLDEILRGVHGSTMLPTFAIGAAGNVNHYALTDPARVHRTKGPNESTRIGTLLAAEALKAYANRRPQRTAPLRMAREFVRLDYHPEKTVELVARIKDARQHFDGEVEVFNDDGSVSFDAEVQVITLGNELAWVGLPGEMFVELGLSLKDASPFQYTMVHTLANGSIGYVPNRRAYPEGAREALATRCAPGSGERLIEAATRLLIQCKNDGQN